MTSPPNKWSCSLLIESGRGVMYRGSGFKIHLTDVNRTAVVTSGHCTCMQVAYASKITVTFPGQRAVDVGPNDIYALLILLISTYSSRIVHKSQQKYISLLV